MDSYVISRFLHILGALGLFMAIGFEWLGLPRLARSATRDDALAWLGVTSLAGRIGAVSLALILLPGLYMAGTRWGFTDWPVAALVGMVVMALLGGLLSGRPMAVAVDAHNSPAGHRRPDVVQTRPADQPGGAGASPGHRRRAIDRGCAPGPAFPAAGGGGPHRLAWPQSCASTSQAG